MISTSEIRISVVTSSKQLDAAARAVHTAFGLDSNARHKLMSDNLETMRTAWSGGVLEGGDKLYPAAPARRYDEPPAETSDDGLGHVREALELLAAGF